MDITDRENLEESEQLDSAREPGASHFPLTAIVVGLPAVAVVAIFSLVPRQPVVPGVSADAAAVAGHVFVYTLLTALVYWITRQRWQADLSSAESAVVAAVVSSSIGLAFEWSQQLFTDGRTFQVEDVLANVAGAVIAAAGLAALEWRGSRNRLILPAVFVLGITLTGFSAASYLLWDPSLPYRGDHWHALYGVAICGELQEPFPHSPGGVHTHGLGVIHIHPGSLSEEGRNATLSRFFESTGGILTNSSITLPAGATYSDGDACPDGARGVLSVSRIDRRTGEKLEVLSNPARYVPRNREAVLFEFGPTRAGTSP